MFNFRKPQKEDINNLIKLSTDFAADGKACSEMPIGKINTIEKAEQRLFGNNAYKVLCAIDSEKTQEKLAGFIGIYSYENTIGKTEYEASILLAKEYRKLGLGKDLCNWIFKEVPISIEVEAFVMEENVASLKASPKMGFKFKERFLDKEEFPGQEKWVSIFTRNGDLK